ncbi:MAG: hypothetical protein QOI56_634 [Actinomycetota bacterium]|nr:hypothetical protein [Actinomycetota bacterium]
MLRRGRTRTPQSQGQRVECQFTAAFLSHAVSHESSGPLGTGGDQCDATADLGDAEVADHRCTGDERASAADCGDRTTGYGRPAMRVAKRLATVSKPLGEGWSSLAQSAL